MLKRLKKHSLYVDTDTSVVDPVVIIVRLRGEKWGKIYDGGRFPVIHRL